MPPFEFESLLRNAKNIFFVVFIQNKPTYKGRLVLAGGLSSTQLRIWLCQMRMGFVLLPISIVSLLACALGKSLAKRES